MMNQNNAPPPSDGSDLTSGLRPPEWRLIYRGRQCRWEHQASLQLGDIDCTDLSDEEFEAFVLTHSLSSE